MKVRSHLKVQSPLFFAAILVAALVSGRSALAAVVPGVYQKIYSGSDVTTGDPADGGDVIAEGARFAAVAAGNPSTSFTDAATGTKYTLGANSTVGYRGVMMMEAGKTYTFVKNFDDSGHIRVVTPDGATTNAVLDSTTANAVAYGSYEPTQTGWHTLLVYLGNGTGIVGPRTTPFTTIPASVLWNSEGLSSITDENKAQWHRLVNDETEGTYLYAEVPVGVLVTGFPENLGTPSPAYGSVDGMVKGTSYAFSCPALCTNDYGTLVWRCTGYRHRLADGTVTTGTTHSVNISYSDETDNSTLTWTWEIDSNRPSSSPAAYAKKIPFTMKSGYITDGVTLTNFPLLVRLSTSIKGFSYDDFDLTNGGDMMFTDERGERLSHEVDEWHTDGTSFVWVRVPYLTKDSVVTLHYGNGASPVNDPADTWREYHAVWHFSEDGGPAYDASGNGRVAMPIGDKRGEQSRAAVKVGYGRRCVKDANLNIGMAGFAHGGTLSLAGYMSCGYNVLNFAGRSDFGLGTPYNSWSVVAKVNGTSLQGLSARVGQGLVHFGYGVHDDQIEIFGQGAYGEGPKIYVTGPIAKGQMDEGTGDLTMPGSNGSSTIDEWRIKRSATSTDWEKADHYGMNDASRVVAGTVADEPAGPVVLAPTIEKTADGWQITVDLASGSARLAVAYECGSTAITNDLTAGVVTGPQTAVDTPTGLAAGKVYRVLALAKDADGNVLSASEGTGLCTEEINLVTLADAGSTNAGLFRVVLGDGRTPSDGPILVKYTVGGTAVAGTDYEPLSGEVWIGAGATNAVLPVVITGLNGNTTTLTLTLAPGAYTIGSEAESSLAVVNKRDPLDLVWTAGAGVHDFATAANWDPQYEPVDSDTVTVAPAAGVDTTARLAKDVSFSATTLSPAADATARLDLNGHIYFNSLGLTTSGDGTVELTNGVFSTTGYTFGDAVVRLTDLLVTNRTSNGTFAFSQAGASVRLNEVAYWVPHNSQEVSALKLTADDIDFAATNLTVRVTNHDASGENLNLNLTGKRIRAALVGAKTYVKGGVTFGADSGNCRVTMTGGTFAGISTGAGGVSLRMSGTSNVVELSESETASKFVYAGFPGSACGLRIARGGSASLDGSWNTTTSVNGTENWLEADDGALTFVRPLCFGTAANSSGNRITLKGTNAVMTASNDLKIGNDNGETDPVTLEFVPGQGFWTEAPFRQTAAGKTVAFSNVVFAVDATTALDARRKNLCKLPLMSFASANATNVDWTVYGETLVMPKHHRGALRLETTLDAKGAFSSATLWCDVKRDVGTVIIVR